jgi:very-short-patch-repair endonuclease
MPHNEVGKIQRARAKRLRGTMTRAETLLWRHLKAHRLSALGFRRQSPMGNYIADFEERIQHDARRDEWFASRGYRVLRFTNDDVMKNLEGVVLAIDQAAALVAPPSLTLPRIRLRPKAGFVGLERGGNNTPDGAQSCP